MIRALSDWWHSVTHRTIEEPLIEMTGKIELQSEYGSTVVIRLDDGRDMATYRIPILDGLKIGDTIRIEFTKIIE